MTDPVLAQLAALKNAPAQALKAKWRTLFDTEPPAYNRRFLESRLAYRIQELAYGGLSRETTERLGAMAKQYADQKPVDRKARPASAAHRRDQADPRMGGRRALRHRSPRRFRVSRAPLQVLSSVARQITGAKWNGWVFFGFKNSAWVNDPPERQKRGPALSPTPFERAGSGRASFRKVRCAVYTRKSSEEGLEMDFNSLDAQRRVL